LTFHRKTLSPLLYMMLVVILIIWIVSGTLKGEDVFTVIVMLGLNLVATTTNTGNTQSWADLLCSVFSQLVTLTGQPLFENQVTMEDRMWGCSK
jgi:hypothetical protein